MSVFSPDIVGFSGIRQFDTIAAASVTRTTIVEQIVDTLTAVGWTKLSGPTPTTFGDEYELVSVQTPWYDTTNVPSWYTGGRIYMKIIHPTSSVISFQFGEYYNNTPTDVMVLEIFSLAPSLYTAGGYNFYILGNPYECWIFSSNTSGNGNLNFYAGTLNIPKYLQQDSKIISAMVATRFRISTSALESSGTSWIGLRTKDAGSLSYEYNSSPAITSFLGIYGGGTDIASGRYLWSPVNDPYAEDVSAWNFHSYSPALAIKPGSSSADYKLVGFLWDSFCVSKSYIRNSTIGLINRVWVAYAGSTSISNLPQAVLFLNIGPTGTTL